jgi:hypothetical protein
MKQIDDYTIGELKELIADREKKEKKDWKEQAKGRYYVHQGCYSGIYKADSIGETPFSYKEYSDAELFAKKVDLMNRMNLFALIHNEGWKARWEGQRQEKWGITHNEDLDFNIERSDDFNLSVFGIAVKSEEIAKAMLEEFKDELDIYLQ